MSQVQWQEEQDYNRDDSAWREAMAADNVDHFADEQSYYCEEHDYLDYENACPYGHVAPVPPPFIANDPDFIDPPF